MRRLALTILVLGLAGCVPVTDNGVGTEATGPKRPAFAGVDYYSGLGFDACTAPATTTMSAWLASPYRAIGIYIGGNSRGCQQPNLTPSWITTVQAQGWSMLPIYVGDQAPCTTYRNRISTDLFAAALQGIASANDAANQAAALGLGRGTPIYYDLESYPRSTTCSPPVKSFVHAWVYQLHQRGHVAGFYSSSETGIRDQVAFAADPNYQKPDQIWFARWNGNPTLADPVIPSTLWAHHQRHHQYVGGHNETWGGITINIDNDSSDGAVAAADADATGRTPGPAPTSGPRRSPPESG
jgi:hypothetical protein